MSRIETSAPADAISRLHVPAAAALDPEARKLVDGHHGENWIKALALNPATARRFADYFGSLFGSREARLPLSDRELIAVAVSTENGCGLCEIHHTLSLGDAIEDHRRARKIALDPHTVDLTPREHALIEFAGKLTREPRAVSPADFDGLRSLGFDDPQILEIVETAAWFNHTNRIFISLGVVPDEKYFDR